MSIYAQFIELAGLDKNVNPQNGTVVCSVASFLFFILLCGLAVCFPRPAMRIVVPVVGGALFVALSMKLLADLRMKSKPLTILSMALTSLNSNFNQILTS